MYDPADFCRELEIRGVDFIAGVPDTVLESFCNYVYQHPPTGGHVLTHNEGGAIALAAGHYFGTGKIPAVYMQNSGIGNALNPILSLANPSVYAVPMLVLVGWRGEPGRKDEPQHLRQGSVTQTMFECLDIPCAVITPDLDEAKAALDRTFSHMQTNPGPHVLLFRHGCFTPSPTVPAGYETPGLTREEAIRTIITLLDPTSPVVASTGMASRELFELREASGQAHERDFLNAGAMGHASMIALGAAMAQPDRQVVCLDGDGALFMHLGALPLAASLMPANFVHILLNNGVHDSVGGQPDLGADVDLESLARTCGYRMTARVEETDELQDAIRRCRDETGPWFVEVRVKRGFRKDLGRPTIPFAEMGCNFRDFLTSGGEPLHRGDTKQ
ncbi:MAG: phosphonopyruvate decarboxylase [Planctomycetaceae bacterium]|nr:phosphonopyruvate decarboxylase [Planctomycetaceae bacterium]